jgi:hypothetical protein
MVAANVPSQIAPVATTLNGSKVKFDWTAPDPGSQPITAYKLEIRHLD